MFYKKGNLTLHHERRYAQHVRLIHHVFTQPQEINIQKVQQHLEESAQGVAGDGRNFSVGIHPLQEGIPAEKWEEWCRAEEERRRLEKEREEVSDICAFP